MSLWYIGEATWPRGNNTARPAATGLEGRVLGVLDQVMLWQGRARRSRAPSEKMMLLVTWWSDGWAQRQWEVVAAHGGPDLQCKTWWASYAPLGRTPRRGIVCHSEGSSLHLSDAGLIPVGVFLTWWWEEMWERKCEIGSIQSRRDRHCLNSIYNKEYY